TTAFGSAVKMWLTKGLRARPCGVHGGGGSPPVSSSPVVLEGVPLSESSPVVTSVDVVDVASAEVLDVVVPPLPVVEVLAPVSWSPSLPSSLRVSALSPDEEPRSSSSPASAAGGLGPGVQAERAKNRQLRATQTQGRAVRLRRKAWCSGVESVTSMSPGLPNSRAADGTPVRGGAGSRERLTHRPAIGNVSVAAARHERVDDIAYAGRSHVVSVEQRTPVSREKSSIVRAGKSVRANVISSAQ